MTVPHRIRKRPGTRFVHASACRPFTRKGRLGLLAQLPRLSAAERRAVLNRLIELDANAEELHELTRSAEEGFLMLDAMEAQDAARQAR